jgi:hypothetical protein
MRTLIQIAALWLTVLVIPVSAETARQLVVVELFTSQGCSSCPPADALLAELAQRDDVLALALHVDYWDYIGWADGFAHPEYTQRQKDYAHMSGERSIYTPQMIIGGMDRVVGFRPMQVADLIHQHLGNPGQVILRVEMSGERIALGAAPVDGVVLPGDLVALLVRFTPLVQVEIEHGENAGRLIDYANIVNEMKPLGYWDGKGELVLDTRFSGPGPAAVILQSRGTGEIVAAARLR